MRGRVERSGHLSYYHPPENWLADYLPRGETTLTFDKDVLQEFERGDVVEIVDLYPGAKRSKSFLDWSKRDVRLVTGVLQDGQLAETQPMAEALAHPCGAYVRVISRAVMPVAALLDKPWLRKGFERDRGD